VSEQGIVFCVDGLDRAYWLKEEAGIAYAGRFTDVVDTGSWNGRGREIVLLSRDCTSIEFVGLVKRSGRVATRRDRLSFTDLTALSAPISFADLRAPLHAASARHLDRYLRVPGGRIPPATWRDLLASFESQRPEASRILSRLRLVLDGGHDWFRGPAGSVVAQEKDAVNLALRVSGIDLGPIQLWDAGEAPAPFLEGLTSSVLIEDQQIQHDAQGFGTWEMVSKHQVGVAVLRDPSDNRLTILNVNRSALENTLGVDLIYYNDRYAAYIAVQYKRMIEEGGDREPSFRPGGGSYGEELERMREFERTYPASGWTGALTEYRLHQGAFYFKLCPRIVLTPSSTEMLTGMYLPLDYWYGLVADLSTDGPRGGTRLTYSNISRYITNTLFVRLVAAGWVGTSDLATSAISEIIRAGIENGRSVILAASYAGDSRST